MAGLSSRKAPQAPPIFITSPTSLLEETHRLINSSRQKQDDIVRNIQPSVATFANVVLPLAYIENSVALRAPILTLYEIVTVDSDLTNASGEARKLLHGYYSTITRHQELYDLVHAVWKKNEDLGTESRRLLEKMYQKFIQNGLHMRHRPHQDRIVEIEERIRQLKMEFRKNRNEEHGSIWFTSRELEGMPDSILSELQVGEQENKGKVRLYFNNPDHKDILSFATNSEVRKKFYIAEKNKCRGNEVLLKEVVVLRDEAARLRGYPNHATLRLEDR